MKRLLYNIHNILTWRYGQNYTFNACGYDFTFWEENEISTNTESCVEKIVDFIDNGKPVITKGVFKNGEFCIICGYDTETKKFNILAGEEHTPKEYDYENVLNYSKAMLFVGSKTQTPALDEVYRKAVMNIPAYMVMPSTNTLSFGKQAFEDWANSFQNGTFDNFPVEDIDPWRIHGTYLCMAGTNGCSRGFLKKVLELNPDMDFINELEPIYAKQGVVFEDLAYRDNQGGLDYTNGGMEGGFNLSKHKIKSKEIMNSISEKILESAKYCDDIIAIFDRFKQR